jgi:hypothetical protein
MNTMDLKYIDKLGNILSIPVLLIGRVAVIDHPDAVISISVQLASSESGCSVNVSRGSKTDRVRPGFNTYDGNPAVIIGDALIHGLNPIGEPVVGSKEEFVSAFMKAGEIPALEVL